MAVEVNFLVLAVVDGISGTLAQRYVSISCFGYILTTHLTADTYKFVSLGVKKAYTGPMMPF